MLRGMLISIGGKVNRINKGSHNLGICIHILTISSTVYIMYQKRKYASVFFPWETENMPLEGNANFTQNPIVRQVNC